MPVTIGSGSGGNDASIPNIYTSTIYDATSNNALVSNAAIGQNSSNPASTATAIIRANPLAKDGLY